MKNCKHDKLTLFVDRSYRCECEEVFIEPVFPEQPNEPCGSLRKIDASPCEKCGSGPFQSCREHPLVQPKCSCCDLADIKDKPCPCHGQKELKPICLACGNYPCICYEGIHLDPKESSYRPHGETKGEKSEEWILLPIKREGLADMGDIPDRRL